MTAGFTCAMDGDEDDGEEASGEIEVEERGSLDSVVAGRGCLTSMSSTAAGFEEDSTEKEEEEEEVVTWMETSRLQLL